MASLLETVSIAAPLLFAYVTGVFLIAQWRHDNSIMDIAYGPAFLCTALGTILLIQPTTLLPFLLLGALAIWSLRLAYRIGKKNWGKPEDPRYAAWRKTWSAHGHLYFLVRSYLQVNLLQGLIIFIVLLPFLVTVSYQMDFILSASTVIGGIVFIVGLSIESIADYQLDQFLARKRAGTEPATLMTTGLFRYSRRPNYFGETLIWWGLTIMVLPLPYGWLAIASPLLITFIVTCVTGPMLEAIFLEKYPEQYRAYMVRTSYFIPLPPRKV